MDLYFLLFPFLSGSSKKKSGQYGLFWIAWPFTTIGATPTATGITAAPFYMHPKKKNLYKVDGEWLKLEKKKAKLRPRLGKEGKRGRALGARNLGSPGARAGAGERRTRVRWADEARDTLACLSFDTFSTM